MNFDEPISVEAALLVENANSVENLVNGSACGDKNVR